MKPFSHHVLDITLLSLSTTVAFLFKDFITKCIQTIVPEQSLLAMFVIVVLIISTMAYLLYIMPHRYDPCRNGSINTKNE